MANAPADSWKSLAARKQAERESRLPQAWRLKSLPPDSQLNVLDVPRKCGLLSADELRITETKDATVLLEQLTSGKVKSVDVVTAFCKRAAIAQQVTNCLTEIFFDDAIRRAKELDDHFKRTGRPLGPLHGLPVSIKDSFEVKGYDATVGIAKLCFRPSQINSALVDLLLKAGAVLYCKTNIPLTMMTLDSHNNVFGRTLNPANRKLTAGGSSGGEGALLAMRGSILGFGTDVGGSIRIPAMCNGLYGVKPSHGRVPFGGMEGGSLPGTDYMGIRASAGPMAHSMRDCELVLRLMSELRAWQGDAEVIPVAWNVALSRKRPLRVGVVRTDGVTTPLPAVSRFLSETVARLQRSGGAVEVVELNITPLISRCQSVVNKIFSIDGYNQVFDNVEVTGEPLSPWLQTRIKRKPIASHERVRELQGERAKLQTAFLKIWSADGGYWASKPSSPEDRLDVLITPVAPHPTALIDKWNTAGYTSSWVLLDYPAGTLPVRKVEEADIKEDIDTTAKPLGPWDKANRAHWTDVDRRVYLGSAQCLQVVAPRWHDQELVQAMVVLDAVLKEDRGRATAKL